MATRNPRKENKPVIVTFDDGRTFVMPEVGVTILQMIQDKPGISYEELDFQGLLTRDVLRKWIRRMRDKSLVVTSRKNTQGLLGLTRHCRAIRLITNVDMPVRLSSKHSFRPASKSFGWYYSVFEAADGRKFFLSEKVVEIYELILNNPYKTEEELIALLDQRPYEMKVLISDMVDIGLVNVTYYRNRYLHEVCAHLRKVDAEVLNFTPMEYVRKERARVKA